MRLKNSLKLFSDTKRVTEFLLFFFNLVVFLLLLNLLSQNLYISDLLTIRIIVVFILAGVFLGNISLPKLIQIIKLKEKQFLQKTIFGLIIIIFSILLLLFTNMQLIWICCIPVFSSGLNIFLQGQSIVRKELHLISIASFFYTFFFLCLIFIPVFWNIFQQFSLFFSSGVGVIFGKSLLLGPSISGLWVISSLVIFIITGFILSKDKNWSTLKWFFLSLITLFVVWIVYLVVHGFVQFEANNDPVNPLIFLLIIGLILTICYILKIKSVSHSAWPILSIDKLVNTFVKTTAPIAVVLFLISVVILTVFIGESHQEAEDSQVLFYCDNMLGSWDIPAYGKYGREATGMFGLLPVYLKQSGYDSLLFVENKTEFLRVNEPAFGNITRFSNLSDYVEFVEASQLTSEIFMDVDVFVVTNLNVSFSEFEKKVVWDFVDSGGSLLVLGDHTNVGEIMDPLNDFLQPSGFQFGFDSALPLDSVFAWITCYQFPAHPVNYQLKDYSEIQISVGASLDIPWNAGPLIVGRYGFADQGNWSNNEIAYLGDYTYNKGEQIGDIILAAYGYYGSGKVVVFGDTSSFQNSALPNSFEYLSALFSWLENPYNATLEIGRMIAGILILVGSLVLWKMKKDNNMFFAPLPVVLSIALVLSAGFNSGVLAPTEISGNIAYIDISHNERFSIEPYTDESLSGFMINLMRNDYQPVILREFAQNKIQKSKLLVCNAPTKSFSDYEIDSLKGYMYSGGIVILCSGYEDLPASINLLSEFDLDIENIPLGPVPYVEENPQMFENESRFVDSWPIIFDESDARVTSFYSFSVPGWDPEYHLMVFAQYGKGGLLLISDSQYLLDKNIESIYDYWPGNILFVKYIFDEFEAIRGDT